MTSCHIEVSALLRVCRQCQTDLKHSLIHATTVPRKYRLDTTFFFAVSGCYDRRMRTDTKRSLSPLLLALVTGALAIVFLLAFQGWIAHGADIFLSLAEAGISWCF